MNEATGEGNTTLNRFSIFFSRPPLEDKRKAVDSIPRLCINVTSCNNLI